MVTSTAAAPQRLAVYTAVYPAVRPFLSAWYQSVQEQTDDGFDLWISLDGLDRAAAVEAIGVEPRAQWLEAPAPASIAEVRQQALSHLVDRYDAIVFVDADDVLHPSRVAAARAALRTADVTACALRVVDGAGTWLGPTFGPSAEADPVLMLPRCNVFGLSNTAYRSDALRAVLPIPPRTKLVDWLLATRAWAGGAQLTFDREARMDYRQYGRNVARVLPPFTADRVREDTVIVLAHYDLALGRDWPMPRWCARILGLARDRVRGFYQRVVGSGSDLAGYVDALNRLPPEYVWWSWVAHPELEVLWSG